MMDRYAVARSALGISVAAWNQARVMLSTIGLGPGVDAASAAVSQSFAALTDSIFESEISAAAKVVDR